MASTEPPVIELRKASKTFGEVSALREVNFQVRRGEIVGLLGDNGSGKSTAVKMMMGVHHPDPGGQVWFDGELVHHWSVAKARSLGVETVYQERALADLQPLWRNMFMGRERTNRFGLLDVRRMRNEVWGVMKGHMGFTSSAIRPDNTVQTMSGGEKQGVAITRALYFLARIVLLDEPTMGLSLSETQKTLDFVRSIKDAGRSAVFIDHNLFHVYPVVDRLVILDRGQIAGEFARDEITLDELTDQMRTVARTGHLES
jgi:simple sugar transport system ATP-binding protein